MLWFLIYSSNRAPTNQRIFFIDYRNLSGLFYALGLWLDGIYWLPFPNLKINQWPQSEWLNESRPRQLLLLHQIISDASNGFLFLISFYVVYPVYAAFVFLHKTALHLFNTLGHYRVHSESFSPNDRGQFCTQLDLQFTWHHYWCNEIKMDCNHSCFAHDWRSGCMNLIPLLHFHHFTTAKTLATADGISVWWQHPCPGNITYCFGIGRNWWCINLMLLCNTSR